MIYLLQSGADGPIKIGYVEYPHLFSQRLRILQVGNPEPLYLITSLSGGIDRERQLHGQFAEGHIRGEWFRRDTPGLSDLISEGREQEAMRLTDHRLRYCVWCKTELVMPPRTRLCSDACEREKKRDTSRRWKEVVR